MRRGEIIPYQDLVHVLVQVSLGPEPLHQLLELLIVGLAGVLVVHTELKDD